MAGSMKNYFVIFKYKYEEGNVIYITAKSCTWWSIHFPGGLVPVALNVFKLYISISCVDYLHYTKISIMTSFLLKFGKRVELKMNKWHHTCRM